jgi:hypothetical protein
MDLTPAQRLPYKQIKTNIKGCGAIDEGSQGAGV